MDKLEPMPVNGDDFIKSRIMTIRGVQVMLDRDLAELYGVTTKRLNEQVKRNIERFPEAFMFRLTKAEMENWRSQIATSNLAGYAKMGVRNCPYAFTEHGIIMLASILKSGMAVTVSIRITNAFVAMRKAFASMAPVMTRIAEVERRQLEETTARLGDQAHNEERFDAIFKAMDGGAVPEQGIFYQNKFWDAKSLLIKFIKRAKKELIVIDAYPGVATLDMLAKRGRGVSVELVTHSNGELAETDYEAFGKQCGKFTKTICGVCHDRFIIADQKEIFWTGASLKDAGRLTFAVAKLGAEVIPGLLASIRKATQSQRHYGAAEAAQ